MIMKQNGEEGKKNTVHMLRNPGGFRDKGKLAEKMGRFRGS